MDTSGGYEQRKTLANHLLYGFFGRNGICKSKLYRPAKYSDISMDYFGIDLDLINYQDSTFPISNVSSNTICINYDIEMMFSTLKLIAKDDSIEIFDWGNRKIKTMYVDTTQIKMTRFLIEDKIVEKRFNYEQNKHKFHDGRIY